MKQKRLKEQVEKIADEATGAYADVIIQMKSERDDYLADLMKVVFQTEQNRSMVVDPEFLLPPESVAFSDARQSRRLLRARDQSFSANLQLARVSDRSAEWNKIDKLSSVSSSASVRSAVGKAQSRLKSKSQEAEPRLLRNISGLRVKVLRGDLETMIEEQEHLVEGVYANAHIPPPKVALASSQSVASGEYRVATWGLVRTSALSSWSAFGTKGIGQDGKPIRVAVLDTGIDDSHPDLQGKVAEFAEFDALGNLVGTTPRDTGTHGTHVAGTIAGGNYSGCWIGMAPDVELIGAVVLNGDEGGSLDQVIAGIDWAVGSGAHIINLSLGALTFDAPVGTPYQRAIVDALVRGSLVVAAIGNDGHQTSGAPGNDYFALAVGAADGEDRCAGFSGGRTHILSQSSHIDNRYLPLVYTKPDLCAPGVSVKSSVPGGGYENYNGTSMATPHVAGAAALLFAATSLLNQPLERRAFLARDLLLGGVSDLGEVGQDQRYGFGSLNVLKSIDEAIKRGF